MRLFKTRKHKQTPIINDESEYPFEIRYWQAKVDNFDYDNKNSFTQRYLFSDKHYREGGPIFFYTGNEDTIIDIWYTMGYMTGQLAEQYGALLIFVEHRYFGTSMPLNIPFDYDIKHNKYLSAEQALFDYVRFMQKFKSENPKFSSAKVFTMGASYGGMLASWARMKFPHVFDGAFADSAPILLFGDYNKINPSFLEIATNTFKYYSETCAENIRQGFRILDGYKNKPETADYDLIRTSIFTCHDIKTPEDINNLQNALMNNFAELAQYNYPPQFPVKEFCTQFGTNMTDPGQIFQSFNVANNMINNEQCLTINPKPSDVGVSAPWFYLACTEEIMPIGSNGVTDMFNPNPWNEKSYAEQCISWYNGDVRPNLIFDFYGGRNYMHDFKTYSNIIFTTGSFDPYDSGCLQKAPNDQLIVFKSISAHGEPSGSPVPGENPTVKEARALIAKAIGEWIKQ